MRKIANVKINNLNAVRLMLYNKGKQGVFVFVYQSNEDSACSWDCHFEDIESAYDLGEKYGVNEKDWIAIGPVLKHCQDDWIKPVRIKGRAIETPLWGRFEVLIDNQWVDLN
jgi:hypothetical protein